MKTAVQWRTEIAQLTREKPGGPWEQALLMALCQDLEMRETEVVYLMARLQDDESRIKDLEEKLEYWKEHALKLEANPQRD